VLVSLALRTHYSIDFHLSLVSAAEAGRHVSVCGYQWPAGRRAGGHSVWRAVVDLTGARCPACVWSAHPHRPPSLSLSVSVWSVSGRGWSQISRTSRVQCRDGRL